MKNCVKIEPDRPSFSRISAMSALVAASPAMTAAGSPGVSRSIRKMSTATISTTGMVERMRRPR